MPDHWTEADGRLLKGLREDTGQDRASFARRCTLSAAQLAELEDGGHGRFYNDRIKAHTGRSLLRKLGYQPIPEPAHTPEHAPQPEIEPIALSEDAVLPPIRPANRRPSRTLLASGLAVVVVVAAGMTLAPGPANTARKSAEAVTVTAAAEPAPPAAVPAAAPAPSDTPAPPMQATASMGRCESLPPVDALAQYTPPAAFRPNTYVYVEAVAPTSVCVTDGQDRQTLAVVKPGDGVSIYGAAPFTVQTRQWNDLRVFFQGIRVTLESPVPPQAVVLNAR